MYKKIFRQLSSKLEIVSRLLSKKGWGNYLFPCNFDVAKLPVQLPTYYYECLRLWSSLTPSSETNKEVVNEFIWNNKFILIDGKSVFNKTLLDKGLNRIKDLIWPRGNFKTISDWLSQGFSFNEAFFIASCIDAIPSQWS